MDPVTSHVKSIRPYLQQQSEAPVSDLFFVALLASVEQSEPTDKLHACAVHDSMHKAPYDKQGFTSNAMHN